MLVKICLLHFLGLCLEISICVCICTCMFSYFCTWTWTCSYLISYWVPVVSVTHSFSFESKRCSYATFHSHSLSWFHRRFPRWFLNHFSKLLVFIVSKRVTVRNPKIDSKSEFGCPRYNWRTWGSAQGRKWPRGHVWPKPWVSRGPHGQRGSLPRVAHAPPTGWVMWPCVIGSFLPSLSSI